MLAYDISVLLRESSTLDTRPVEAVCKFPSYYDGSWYHRASGKDTDVQIRPSEGTWADNQAGLRRCKEVHMHVRQEDSEGANYTMLLQS